MPAPTAADTAQARKCVLRCLGPGPDADEVLDALGIDPSAAAAPASSAEPLDLVTALDPPPTSIRDVQQRTGLGVRRARHALFAWRAAHGLPTGEGNAGYRTSIRPTRKASL